MAWGQARRSKTERHENTTTAFAYCDYDSCTPLCRKKDLDDNEGRMGRWEWEWDGRLRDKRSIHTTHAVH